MRELRPYLKLFRQHWVMLFLGLVLTLCTLLAGLGLLSLSGWFLTACAVAGLNAASKDAFNYMTPAGAVRFSRLYVPPVAGAIVLSAMMLLSGF